MPADATVECDAIPAAATVTATDNCDPTLTVAFNEVVAVVEGCGTITRTWTVTDNCGNTTTDSQTLSVQDNTDPVLVGVPADATVECDAIPAAATVTATDNCDPTLTVAFNEVAAVVEGCGTITRTWTVTDNCGNTTTDSQTLSVQDNTDPVLVGVPADATVECDAIPAAATVTATDNCDPTLTVAFNEVAAVVEGCGTITRTWTVTDNCGNTTTDSQTLSVQDNTDPVLVGVPADATVECDAIPAAATVTATDNCDPTLTVAFNEVAAVVEGCGTITRTWTVTDNCGNTTTDSQTLSVQDNTDPVLVGVPADATVECDAIPAAATVTATDNCDPTLTVAFNEVAAVVEGCGTITRTWTVTDNCGNTTTDSQTLSVQDNTDPVLVGVPADATVECDAIPAAATVTATDNCDPTLTVAFNEVAAVVEGCGTITRTWTVTDNCGNTTTDSQTLSVQDNTDPVLVGVPADATVECDAIPAAATVTATDNCDPTLTVAFNEVAAVVEGCGTITRTWTVTDNCGNTTTDSQTLSVQDNTDPVLVGVPADATVECDAIPAAATVTATDNCDPTLTVAFNEVAAVVEGCGTITRTWTVTDNCGNTTTDSQTLSVQDNTDPVLVGVPADATVECDAIPAAATVTATDNCDPTLTVAFNEVAAVVEGCGTITRTWTVTDNCGNTTTDSQTLSVQDNTDPVLVGVPADATVECDAIPAAATVTATDNCDPTLTVAFNEVAAVVEGCGTITRTWTVTDNCGNTTTDSQTLSVQDNTDPVLVGVPADATVECDAIPAAATVTATDNCDPTLTVAFNEVAAVVEGCGTITRTWTVTDNCGNTTTDSQTLSVQDNTDPVLVGVPADATVECDAIPAAATVTATDNCDPTLTVAFNEVAAVVEGCGTITRTWTVTDNCGNTTTDSQTLSVQDNTDPVLVGVPADATVECDAIPAAATVTATDNCDPTLTVAFNEVAAVVEGCGTITRTWTVTDNCGNTTTDSQTLSVQDNTDPVLVGVPADATVECDAIPAAATVTATDNCDPTLTVAFNEVAAVVEGCGTITRTWTVTDNCGNTTTDSQTLSVQDNTDPVLVGVPADATVECDAIPAAATVTATDNCDPTLTVAFNEVAAVVEGCGTITRTWTVTDNCGNTTTDSQTLSVQDNTDPVLVGVPADATVECDAIPAAATVTATDNCDPTLTVAFNEVAAVVEGCGTITRTWTVTDNCGNTTTDSQTLSVQDNTDPVLVGVPADATVECDAIPAAATVTATDNCDPTLTVAFNEVAAVVEGCGTITRTWTVTDNCGNTTTDSQTLSVQDNTDPVLVGVPADATVECDAIPAAATVTATDNCDPTLTVAFNEVAAVVEGCGTITRTWTVTDNCGNTTTDSQTLSVQDNTDPVLVGVPADATVECDAIPAAATVTATDNCDPTLTVAFNEVAAVVEGCGTITRTWTVTDNCGNTTTDSQTLSVQDNTDPVLVGVPADATVECDAIPAAATVTATDNCDPTLTVAFNEVAAVVEGCGTITRTWTVTDNCGNTTTDSQTLSVQDNTDPVLVGVPADATVECDAIPAAATVTATDNCDPTLTVAFNEVAAVVEGCGTITRTWTVTDNCGNTTTDSQTLSVQDNTDPVLVGVPADATVECDAIPAAATVTATDNCDPTLTVAFNEVAAVVEGCGTITRTWTVTDNCGNTTTDSQTLSVQDLTAPTITCPPSQSICEESGNNYTIPEATIGTDNCDGTVTVTYEIAGATSRNGTSNDASGIFNVGISTITWIVEDECGNSSSCTTTVTINQQVTPTFPAVAAYCSGATIDPLPTTSIEGINGTWSPAINNTATTLYTFTPTAGQCATTATLTITITDNTTPTFPAVAAYCSGATIDPLPTTSIEGINGTWSPAINNTATTLYTFTPTAGQCATTATLTITITDNTTPTFPAVAAYCSGATIDPLPTTSIEGINGTWSPAINNTATTLYTFTPTAGQCATTATLTITITDNTTPTFPAVAAYCSGATIARSRRLLLKALTVLGAPLLIILLLLSIHLRRLLVSALRLLP